METVDPAKAAAMPQELENRAVRARRRFKAIVRLAFANKRWLEDVEDEQLSRNVKKNVQLLTRKKAKKGLLTLQQKAILCKPAADRTEQEKILLNRIIGGLKCFRKYPDHVKMQLAGVTYFMYYGPNRVIVRQNHEAHALYFILTGEVTVSITTWDPVIKENVTVNVGTMVAGSMFGEVSLLHDIPRTATITTATPCELLCLKKADFDIVLKASVKEQWDEIQRAMSRFTYFDGWDEVAVRECCIYSKIKPFIRDQTILGDGVGVPSSTYFVLKGQCRVIEHLLVTVSYNEFGRKQYEIYNPEVPKQEEEEDDVTILDEKKQSVTSLPSEPRTSIFPSTLTDAAGRRKSHRPSMLRRRTTVSNREERAAVAEDEDLEGFVASADIPRRSMMTSIMKRRTVGADNEDTESHSRRERSSGVSMMKRKTEGASTRSSNVSKVYPETTKPILDIKKEELAPSVTDLPIDVETHFMQVCVFSELACFGLGENLKRRRVVAMSDYVECLLIPRYWLYQHNRSNIWTRIQQYLDSRIPNTEQVFNEFLTQRRWFKYRADLTHSIFKKPPVTAYYNIPYSIRINEEVHLE